MINEFVFESFPKLESERLLFRELVMEDASEIQSIRSNPDVMRYLDNDGHPTIDISQNFIKNNIESYNTRNGLYWVIIEKKSNQFIGDFSFWKLDKKNHRAEIGYTLKPQFWGQGCMFEAMHTLINFGFKIFKLHSMEANINPANENSRKLLLKIGFSKEAYFRENYFYNGKYLDSEIYSLLEADFKNNLKD